MNKTHQYHPLDASRSQIRLLDLQPGEFEDPIYAKLRVCPLDDDLEYKFEALSYTWGDATQTTAVTIDNNADYQVTLNLGAALRHIRHAKTVRTIWIDAICINQCDIPERNHQVTMMRRIYSAALRIVVWLDLDMEFALPALIKLARFDEEPELGDDPSYWEPLQELFADKYWSRVWIQQELILAPTFYIQCRHHCVPGNSFVAFQEKLADKSSEQARRPWGTADWAGLAAMFETDFSPARNLSGWRFRVRLGKVWDAVFGDEGDHSSPHFPQMLVGQPSKKPCTDSQALLGVLNATRGLNSTDPRDKIYGVLGLASDCSENDIVVDYNKSQEEVLTSVSDFVLRKYNRLDFLAFCASVPQGLQQGPKIPSWVPSWSSSSGSQFLTMEEFIKSNSASGSLNFDGAISGDGRALEVRGFQIDKVKKVGEDRVLDKSVSWVFQWLCDLGYSSKRGEPVRIEKPERIGCLSRFLCGIRSSSKATEPIRLFPLSNQALETLTLGHTDLTPDELYGGVTTLFSLQTIPEYRDAPMKYLPQFPVLPLLKPTSQQFFSKLYLTLGCGRIVVSEKGRFAYLPDIEAKVMDEIWVLFGCPFPVVLRPTAEGNYSFVSPAYMAGVMKGELVTGVGNIQADVSRVGEFEVKKVNLM